MSSFVAGPAIGGALATMWGPQVPFYVVGAMTAACSAGYSLLPETLQNPQPLFQRKEDKADALSKAPKKSFFEDWGDLLRDPNQQVQLPACVVAFLHVSIIFIHSVLCIPFNQPCPSTGNYCNE